MLEKTGIPSAEQVESVFPDTDRLKKGPVAVIECFQTIPCNPCATSCPRGAILPFEDINDIPVIDRDKCNGCALCMMKCPGLAIMVVDLDWSDMRALVKLTYEFRPLPEKGSIVRALDRAGKPIGDAEVINVVVPQSKTPIVSIAVDKSLIKRVRNIGLKNDFTGGDGIICRCSDITVESLREYIRDGYTSVDEIKRVTRLGMGPCQGRTCVPLVIRELSRMLKIPMERLNPGTYRPSVMSVKLGALAEYSESEAKP